MACTKLTDRGYDRDAIVAQIYDNHVIHTCTEYDICISYIYIINSAYTLLRH